MMWSGGGASAMAARRVDGVLCVCSFSQSVRYKSLAASKNGCSAPICRVIADERFNSFAN